MFICNCLSAERQDRQAVLATNPQCKVYGIGLAKAESVAYCPNPENDHVPANWDTLWGQGEREHDAKFKKD